MRWMWFAFGVLVLAGGYQAVNHRWDGDAFAQLPVIKGEAKQELKKESKKEEVQIELPAEVQLEPGRLTTVPATTKGKTIKWLNPHKQVDVIPSESGRWAIVASPVPGRYPIYAYTAIDGEPTNAGMCIVIVGKSPGPTPPTPPVPPEPGPTPPVPPEPGPTPPTPPAPIPEDGFRVLMIYETATVQKLPLAKQAVLNSTKVRDYMDAKCIKGPDGKMPEWRIWDKDVDTSGAHPVWQKAMQRPRTDVPWIIISNGKTGYEGALPANIDDALKLLKKYGGE